MTLTQTTRAGRGSIHMGLSSLLHLLRVKKETRGTALPQEYVVIYFDISPRSIEPAGILLESELSVFEWERQVAGNLRNTLPFVGLTQSTQKSWSSYASPDEAEVLSNLADSGGDRAAQRLNDLIEMFAQDPDVGRLNFDSFKSVADFFKRNNDLEPSIVAGWDGTLAVEWRLPPIMPQRNDQACSGILCLEFLPNGKVEYSGFAMATDGGEEIEYEGSSGLHDIIDDIHTFLQRM